MSGTEEGEHRKAVIGRLERIEVLLRVLADEQARRDRELVALLTQIAGKQFAG